MDKKRKPINNILNVTEVKRIRAARFKKSAKELAAAYDVHLQTIYKIWNNTNWAWVQ